MMMLMTMISMTTVIAILIGLIISSNIQNHSSGVMSDHIEKLSVEMKSICLLILTALLSGSSEEKLKPIRFAFGLSHFVVSNM